MTAVEFAIVVPILLLIVIGILEFAFVMRDYLSVASAVRTGVRVAATGAGAGPGTCPGLPVCNPADPATFDYPALAQSAADAIQQAGSAMPLDQIDYILVYKANVKGFPAGTANDQTRSSMPTPAECDAIGKCIVFRWARSINRFVFDGASSWSSESVYACAPKTDDPATARNEKDGPDSVGVYMHATHPYLTKLFGATITVENQAILQFEPLANKLCNDEGPTNGGHQ